MNHSIHPLRVFVAEDDYLLADDLAGALERAGAVVVGPVPTLPQARERWNRSSGVEVAILDINLNGEMVFPLADLLREEGVPIVFFSGCDEIAIPERFSCETRVSKVEGISGAVSAALERCACQIDGDQVGTAAAGIIDLLPLLRLHARQLTGDEEAADNVLERALENAVALAEKGALGQPVSARLHKLIQEAYEHARRH